MIYSTELSGRQAGSDVHLKRPAQAWHSQGMQAFPLPVILDMEQTSCTKHLCAELAQCISSSHAEGI